MLSPSVSYSVLPGYVSHFVRLKDTSAHLWILGGEHRAQLAGVADELLTGIVLQRRRGNTGLKKRRTTRLPFRSSESAAYL